MVTGISAGAVNSAVLSAYAPEDIVEAAQFLSDTCAELTNSSVWSFWDYEGPIEGCFKERGCLDDSPMIQTLGDTLKLFPEGYKRRITLGSVDANTGDFITFDQNNTDFSEINLAAVAASSIPVAFPPLLYKGMTMLDGMTDQDVNMISAINQCLEVVDDQSKIIIDTVIVGHNNAGGFDAQQKSYENYLDARQLRKHANGMNAINW